MGNKEDHFSMSTSGQVIRWILVPFASFGGSFALYAIAMLWCGVQDGIYYHYSGDIHITSLTKIILFLVCQGIAGYAFVFCGSRTAPKHRKYTSIILATIMTILCAVTVVYNVIVDFDFLNLIGTICTIIGAICSSFYTEENDN